MGKLKGFYPIGKVTPMSYPMPLNDVAIRNARPEAKQKKLYDSRGLFLLVTPRGGKWWRFKYRFGGKEKLISLGTYPQVSLKDAREKRDKAKKLLRNRIDPAVEIKSGKILELGQGSFEAVANTEQKKADELLLESKLKYQNLVESTSDWVWEVDEAGRYTYVSQKVKDLLGYEPEEIINKTPFELMPSEEAKRIKETFITAVTQKAVINSLENTNLHKDGHPVIFETSASPIFDTKGKFCGYRGINRDISKRKETENKLLEKMKKMEELNIALRVILKESEITKDELEKNFLSNIKGLLLPYVTELESRLKDKEQQFLMDIIKTNINEITSLFTRKLKLEIEDLTPKEIQVADLIKQGRTNKEIAKLLNITTSGVVHHRRNLRKKFNIKGKKINLRSHLLNM